MQSEKVIIEKLVHGGQGIGTLADGRKVFLWNALPGETVMAELRKNKKDFAEGFAVEIIKASPQRIEPMEPEMYLATSPWQIVRYEAENEYKKAITAEAFEREHLKLPKFEMVALPQTTHYRNKMEYSFYGDDKGLHLALYNRGSHRKHIVNGSVLAMPAIDEAAHSVASFLESKGVQARQLKSLMIRCTQQGHVVAALFVKDQEFIDCSAALGKLQGLAVYYSFPKSPASVITKELQQHGDVILEDDILGTLLSYEAHSFFQVNIPIFERAVTVIKQHIKPQENVVDMYAGVGSIGLNIQSQKLTLVEIDRSNAAMAEMNSIGDVDVVRASSEGSVEYITADTTVIVDPPRAGLHLDVTKKLLEVLPPKIVYLSCNPATQARDLALLEPSYNVDFFEGYNFFPRTPHIETLAVMIRK